LENDRRRDQTLAACDYVVILVTMRRCCEARLAVLANLAAALALGQQRVWRT
jgi:hypothetical protein